MALSKKKTQENPAQEAKGNEESYVIEVTRVKELENCFMFDAKVNGVMIYGMSYKELQRKDGSGSFVKIDFPSRKGNDGKYYSHCYFKVTDAMITTIEEQIEKLR